jgi:sulfofructose kinase
MSGGIDVLCVGQASYDLVFSIGHHLGPDEKGNASSFISCGGGPAANAAVAVARLGLRSAFNGYLGKDEFGRKHMQELSEEGVCTDLVTRGMSPTPISAILVKPDGKRTIVNHKAAAKPSGKQAADCGDFRPRVILFDGHEPFISSSFIPFAIKHGLETVLDAGSVHPGTLELLEQVDHVVASERFAHDFTGTQDVPTALQELSRHAPSVVVTLGDKGLAWKNQHGTGRMRAFPIEAVDSTGAGDAFHGAFAAGLAKGYKWEKLLEYSSAVGALSCMELGGRPAIPNAQMVLGFLKENRLQKM